MIIFILMIIVETVFFFTDRWMRECGVPLDKPWSAARRNASGNVRVCELQCPCRLLNTSFKRGHVVIDLAITVSFFFPTVSVHTAAGIDWEGKPIFGSFKKE
ncbi:hypothetical protein CBR_g31708 [Chara braunii]|uniref:Uncharacterized protein n=1 Tax=Chara braunii TaxID=69332 RepID=A0A388JXZ3_CHABU|nr:hypothetical protein CBR_g31708 [Chara braunii]|eukprot:GBG62691.1 hypothetical protein CBR_g31708 [Chara braunii]